MIDQTYVITVREAPKSINASGGGTRANRFVAHREKMRWEGLYLKEFLVARVRRGMQFCSVDVTVRFKHRAARPRDEENWRQPVIKPLADSLQKGSYLEDDSAEWFRVQSFRLEEGIAVWPYTDPRVKSELIVALHASYF